ncbi:GAS2-like protein 1 [Dinothrombium tinctorium]|uniref:GAS2-like protein 1 n=1 Tax=Dinothrombium tinctorium TaxID=1965070 RepID=A0A3S3QEG4_9ACAR|nr:GAS2-like protein 1 [Dinothrombium tinctorium]
MNLVEHNTVRRNSSPLHYNNGAREDELQMVQLESRSLRAFKSSEEYLYAMKEDLAEWLNTLYSLDISVDDFMEKLETGVVLCRHANNLMQKGRKMKSIPTGIELPEKDVVYRVNVEPKTFHARDNVSNFIAWCRKMKIHECLLFETDDLVLRKNERSFILCLLEVARKGSQFGVTVPLLVQMEQEIDREIQNETECDKQESYCGDESNPQTTENNLKHLHERVSDVACALCH